MQNFSMQVDLSVMARAKQLTTTKLVFLNVLLQPTFDPDQISAVKEYDDAGESVMRLMTCADWNELSRILEICAIAGPER